MRKTLAWTVQQVLEISGLLSSGIPLQSILLSRAVCTAASRLRPS